MFLVNGALGYFTTTSHRVISYIHITGGKSHISGLWDTFSSKAFGFHFCPLNLQNVSSSWENYKQHVAGAASVLVHYFSHATYKTIR